jgi:hypothetical protein
MAFYFTLLLDIIISIALGIALDSFWLGLAFYVGLAAITTLAFIALDLLLGEKGQDILVKKSNFHILHETKDAYIVYREKGKNFSVSKDSITDTDYDLVELYPFVTIEKWRTRWYVRFFRVKDIPSKYYYRIILKLPVTDGI